MALALEAAEASMVVMLVASVLAGGAMVVMLVASVLAGGAMALLEGAAPAAASAMTWSQKVFVAGRTLPGEEEVCQSRVMGRYDDGVRSVPVATSIPHFSTTQPVAALMRAFLFSQTQLKSVAWQGVPVPTALMMQGRAHEGMTEMSAAAARPMIAARVNEYFVLTVLVGSCGGLFVGRDD